MPEREVMPIMKGVFLKTIPWALIAPHERQAQSNHSQTLERLAQRGGLCPNEATRIIQDRPWLSTTSLRIEIASERGLMRLIAAMPINKTHTGLDTPKEGDG